MRTILPFFLAVALSAALPAQTDWFEFSKAEGQSAGDRLGYALDAIGDIDGDGMRDFLVGAFGADPSSGGTTLWAAGSAYLLSGADSTTLLRVDGASTGAMLGMSVVAVGDQDADGREDFAVGAPYERTSLGPWTGVVRVVSSATGSIIRTFEGDLVFSGFGLSLGTADLNGDGTDELLVGAPLRNAGAGAAYAYDIATGSELVFLEGSAFGDYLGLAIDGIGDNDLDGKDEYALAAPGYATLAGNEVGRVDVYNGTSTATLGTLEGSAAGDRFGWSLSGGVDGDSNGAAEILVGSPGGDLADLFLAVPPFAHLDGLAGSAGDYFGCAVSQLGDLDGDALPDLVVGARLSNAGAGQASTFSFAGSVLTPLEVFTGDPDARLGTALGGMGDADSNGIDELMLGSPDADGANQVARGGVAASWIGMPSLGSFDLAIYGRVESGYDLAVTVRPSYPGDTILFYVGDDTSTTPILTPEGVEVNLTNPVLFATEIADGSGIASTSFSLVGIPAGFSLRFQAIDRVTPRAQRTSQVRAVDLPSEPLDLISSGVLKPGNGYTLTAGGCTQGSWVHFYYSTVVGSDTSPQGYLVELRSPITYPGSPKRAPASGFAFVSTTVPSNVPPGIDVYFQAVEALTGALYRNSSVLTDTTQ